MATVYREGPWLDSVKRVWSHFSYRDTRKVYDAEVITADYLIDNIDHAFEVWGKRPWAKYYSFDDFCEYVLPYRIANEPLEAWRRVYYDRYAATVDSMYGGSDVLEVVKAVRKKFKEEGFIWNTHFSLPALRRSVPARPPHRAMSRIMRHHGLYPPRIGHPCRYRLLHCFTLYQRGALLDYIKGYHRAVCPILDYPDGAGKRGG